MNSRDAVALDGFAWPSALKDAAAEKPDAKAVRVCRSRGDVFATVTVLNCEGGPVVATVGDKCTRFGRNRLPVLTITAHGANVRRLQAMLRNLADALDRTDELTNKLNTPDAA